MVQVPYQLDKGPIRGAAGSNMEAFEEPPSHEFYVSFFDWTAKMGGETQIWQGFVPRKEFRATLANRLERFDLDLEWIGLQ